MADFLTGENWFIPIGRIHFEYQITCFLPACVHGSLPVIMPQRVQMILFRKAINTSCR